MEYLVKVVAALVVVAASAIAIHLVRRAKKACRPANLPPGSLGLPVIGHTLGLLRAVRANRFDEWWQDRIDRYGPVSKVSLFGTPTVLLTGLDANKLIFFSSALRVRQMESFRRIIGERSMLDLHGDDHRRVRGALMGFLKPDNLKQYVGRVDAKVRQHLAENWHGRSTVTVMPLIKQLTFNMITSLLFGLEAGHQRDALSNDFRHLHEGMFAVPVNLPFTAFSRSIKACRRARQLLHGITRHKMAQLATSNNKDLITLLLSLTNDHGDGLLTHQEIVDNCMLAMFAGHDTTSILITFTIRHLAKDPLTLAAMVQEHDEIAENKADGEALTWEDLSKMKLTWRVAQETLRMVPPGLGFLRRAFEDIEFNGYCIPKGWQVLLSTNAAHMDPTIFHDPSKFDPSRFEKPRSATPPCSFVAFGGGPRICPGMDLAKTETLVTIHYLLRQFRWKLCCKEDTFDRTPFPSPLHGLPIKLEHKASLPAPPKHTSTGLAV